MARTKQTGRKRKNKGTSPNGPIEKMQGHTPSKHIDPNFGDKTCQGSEKSSSFWLKEIPDVYPGLSRYDKIGFIKEMIIQAYASLHNKDHRDILTLLHKLSKDDKGVSKHILQLHKAYDIKNRSFKCTCGLKINEEVLKDIANMNKQKSPHGQIEALQGYTPSKYIDPNFGDKTCQGSEMSSSFWLKEIPDVYPGLSRCDKIRFIKDMIIQAYASLHKNGHRDILSLLHKLSKAEKGVCQRVWQLQKAYNIENKRFECTCGTEINREILKDMTDMKRSNFLENDNAPIKYIDPNFGKNTCQGNEESSSFWLKEIPAVYPDLSLIDKIFFVKNMILQAFASLHSTDHKKIGSLLMKFSEESKGIYKHISQLQKAYTKKNKDFKCTCGSEMHQWVLEDIENMEKRASQHYDTTPSKYIDPNFGDKTCQGSEKSSSFWLKEISTVFSDLSPNDKISFIKDMISQAYASLHTSDHKEIWSLLYNSSINENSVCKHIWKLRMAYTTKNKNFECTCGMEKNQEVLQDIENLEKSEDLPPQKKAKLDKPWVNIVDPYFGDTTCEGAEKSSLFWISKIENEFSDLSRTKKNKFIANMASQIHPCLHKDYHKTILVALAAGSRDKQYNLTDKLEKKYHVINMTFECTCGLELSDTIKQGRKEKESFGKQESPENNEKDKPEHYKKQSWDTIINPYLMDTTCEGSEKSSLFWLDKIKEGYNNFGKKKKVKFVQDMISQVHASIHKDFHKTLISELYSGAHSGPGDRKKLNYLINVVIPKLEVEYKNINMKFACTCDLSFADKTKQTEETADSNIVLYSSETKEECAQDFLHQFIDGQF